LEADRLAKRIAGDHGKPDNCFEARTVAEAELTILRVRMARAKLLDLNRSAKAKQSVADPLPVPGTSRASADQDDLAHAYLRALLNLIKLDRYERRALSRRREALRLLWSG
jgi:hypothetical protein